MRRGRRTGRAPARMRSVESAASASRASRSISGSARRSRRRDGRTHAHDADAADRREGSSFATTSVTSSVCGPVPRCASTARRTQSAMPAAGRPAFSRTTSWKRSIPNGTPAASSVSQMPSVPRTTTSPVHEPDDGRVGERGALEDARRRPRSLEVLDHPGGGAHDEAPALTRVGEVEPTRRGIEDAVEERHELPGGRVVGEMPVHHVEEVRGPLATRALRSQRRAPARHHERRADSVARHVADREGEAPVRERARRRIVEVVAARLVAVVREAGDVRRPRPAEGPAAGGSAGSPWRSRARASIGGAPRGPRPSR